MATAADGLERKNPFLPKHALDSVQMSKKTCVYASAARTERAAIGFVRRDRFLLTSVS
jgi:hypothetical protein